ncbi:hypothetical protein D9O36_03280 [Zobellia amurskyensis]|uniref:Uncharacterized protein n=1 Tax=Zobellia amurskyensis TaxID=248905 RepID=A0A7X2ZR29_9FLAO|nr:hypothetical protein [Zobellia amurskyensis]
MDGVATAVLAGVLHGYIILMDGEATDTEVITTLGDIDTVLGAGAVTAMDMVAITAVLAGVVTEHGVLLTAITMDITITRTETEVTLTIGQEEATKQTRMLFRVVTQDMFLVVQT